MQYCYPKWKRETVSQKKVFFFEENLGTSWKSMYPKANERTNKQSLGEKQMPQTIIEPRLHCG